MNVNWVTNVKLASIAARFRAEGMLLSEAAKAAEITPLEFMEYLASIGHVSDYSVRDFEEGQAMLDEFLDYKPPARRAGIAKKVNRAL